MIEMVQENILNWISESIYLLIYLCRPRNFSVHCHRQELRPMAVMIEEEHWQVLTT